MSQTIECPNFGAVEFVAEDVLELAGGMPGFKGLNRFLLIQGEDLEPFKFLQSLDQPAICFPMIDPRHLDAGYRPQLNTEQQAELELADSKDGLVFSIVTLTEDPSDATANLFAPIVVNTANMKAAQILLIDSGYSVDEPLLKV
jgi:flagellar assembly factor FliW